MAVFTPTAQARACDRRRLRSRSVGLAALHWARHAPRHASRARQVLLGCRVQPRAVNVRRVMSVLQPWAESGGTNLGACAVSAASVSGDERVNRFSSSTMRFCASAIAATASTSASEATDAMRASRSTWSLAAPASPHQARAAQLDADRPTSSSVPSRPAPVADQGFGSPPHRVAGHVPDTRRLSLVVASCNVRGVASGI